MPDHRNRKRRIPIRFFADENELNTIKTKMAPIGTENMRAYQRKMAIGGYVIKLNMPELRELLSQMRGKLILLPYQQGAEGRDFLIETRSHRTREQQTQIIECPRR